MNIKIKNCIFYKAQVGFIKHNKVVSLNLLQQLEKKFSQGIWLKMLSIKVKICARKRAKLKKKMEQTETNQ